MTEPPDEPSDQPETPAATPDTPQWTPPEQPTAGGHPPLFHPYPSASLPGGYPPPSPQSYYGFTPPPPSPRNALGTASLVLGIFALLFSWFPLAGVIVSICVVAMGVAARRRVKRGEADNNGATVAGIVLGIVALIISGAILLLILYLIISYQECLAHAVGRYEYGQCGHW